MKIKQELDLEENRGFVGATSTLKDLIALRQVATSIEYQRKFAQIRNENLLQIQDLLASFPRVYEGELFTGRTFILFD